MRKQLRSVEQSCFQRRRRPPLVSLYSSSHSGAFILPCCSVFEKYVSESSTVFLWFLFFGSLVTVCRKNWPSVCVCLQSSWVKRWMWKLTSSIRSPAVTPKPCWFGRSLSAPASTSNACRSAACIYSKDDMVSCTRSTNSPNLALLPPQFNDQLISPKEFVCFAGKSTLKDWKRAIRLNGTMLRFLVSPFNSAVRCSYHRLHV